jgi:hypothetical protein
MSHEDVEVRTFWRYTLCECGGRLTPEPDQHAYLTSPPMFLHSCITCGKRQTLRHQSPQFLIEAIE